MQSERWNDGYFVGHEAATRQMVMELLGRHTNYAKIQLDGQCTSLDSDIIDLAVKGSPSLSLRNIGWRSITSVLSSESRDKIRNLEFTADVEYMEGEVTSDDFEPSLRTLAYGLTNLPALDRLSYYQIPINLQLLQQSFGIVRTINQDTELKCKASTLDLTMCDIVLDEDTNYEAAEVNSSVTSLIWTPDGRWITQPQLAVAPLLLGFQNLKFLKLGRCKMTDLTDLYPHLTGKQTKLEILDVRGNNIGWVGTRDFLTRLPEMASLRRILMYNNPFETEQVADWLACGPLVHGSTCSWTTGPRIDILVDHWSTARRARGPVDHPITLPHSNCRCRDLQPVGKKIGGNALQKQ
ncbi:unnamed protein product [Cylindrotheca closterium]|uniref:Uncharacterized protein n=1 Tax=Cylindrotheca closterium TaxID=2856 RepID=A0AAD2FM10_9STRA|nr:unnamed protein product [Cylindrotheca closterium]